MIVTRCLVVHGEPRRQGLPRVDDGMRTILGVVLLVPAYGIYHLAADGCLACRERRAAKASSECH